jgi:pimeloyl-ACP methyl ester carboxylesterase
MSRFVVVPGLLLLFTAFAGTPHAADRQRPAPMTSAGLDARLTGFAYPYEVALRRFESQGQTLEMAYMDVSPARGKANGKTVLLLHGKNFSGAYWGSTIEALVADGYRVIAPDQIGFGKSSKPRHFQFSFHELAMHTQVLLADLGVSSAAVVGHSMGGMLAARYALMFPERTDALILVNPIGLEDWKTVVPYRSIDALYKAELSSTPERVKEYMRKAYFDGTWRPAYDPLIAIQAGWTVGPDRDLTAWVSALTSDMIFTQPVLYEFPLIRVPTLLVIGTRDRTAVGRNTVAPEVARTLGDYTTLGDRAAAAIPGAELVKLDGVGHVPQYEAYEPYMTALKRFLARYGGG